MCSGRRHGAAILVLLESAMWVWRSFSYHVPRCKEKSSSCNLRHFFPDLQASFPCPVEQLHRRVVRGMSAVTNIAHLPSSAFFRQRAPLEASPAKCISLSKLSSFGKGHFCKLNAKIWFVLLLTKGTGDAFRVA